MQSTSKILLVRPANFAFNRETAVSNTFQNTVNYTQEEVKTKVASEFESFVATLISQGVDVTVVNDTSHPRKPDAIFPNNWVSFHENGKVILYPMCAPNRRFERRLDLLEDLKKKFVINEVIDLSYFEKENRFLEGTGSIIFDHLNKIAYACLSPRTDKAIFIQVCDLIGYEPIYFTAVDKQGQAIYHTNVMMCVGEKFCVICLDSISDQQECEKVSHSLTSSGHQIIEISYDQMNRFAGNMLTLKNAVKMDILALSQSAYDSLTSQQVKTLERYCQLVPLPIPTIETIGGGSARCMIAEIFLPQKA